MNKITLSFAASVLTLSLFAQEPSKLSTFYSIGRLNATGSFGGIGTVMAGGPNSIEGNEFYDTPDFKNGFISVSGYEKPFGEFPMRFNVRSREIEIQEKGKVVSLSMELVKSFMYEDEKHQKHFFFNGKGYKIGTTSADGFFEVLVEGSVLLLKRRIFEHKKTSFNPLDVENSTSEKLLKKDELFLLKEGTVDLVKLPIKKKDLFAFLSNPTELENFLKEKHIGVKEEGDLVRLVAFCNSIRQSVDSQSK